MPTTTERKKKASEKTLPSYPAPSLSDLLVQYDDWVVAARLPDLDLMRQLYEPLVLGTIALNWTLNPSDPLMIELNAASKIVWDMKAELSAKNSRLLGVSPEHPSYKSLRFTDPQVIERLAWRIARIKRMSGDNQNAQDVPEGYTLSKHVKGKDGLPIHVNTIRSWADNDHVSPKHCTAGLAWPNEFLDRRIPKHKRQTKRKP